MYLSLKQELARYRQAAAGTERVTIAQGKSIEPDTHDERVLALRTRLSVSGDLDAAQDSESDLYDATVQAAVRRFQERMGLVADGKLDARTITELNVPLDERITQLRVNLDRGRVLLQDLPDEFVVVNIAAYSIFLVRGQEIVWNARAQVGKTYRRTPMFRSDIDYLVLNPTWTVPPGIIRNDILPDARRDPASITRRGLDVLDASGNKVDPASINWSKFKSGNIPYTLRQEPGPKNALGRVKIMFPNSYSVYLHDTPSQSKFEETDRAFSSGCVRVERPLELAELLLADPAAWNTERIEQAVAAGHTQNVTLPNKVPVLLAYWTAWVDPQGRVNFRRDVYGQDAQWAAGLARPYTARASAELTEDAPFQDRPVPDRPPDAHPQTPGFGGRRADTDGQRTEQCAPGEEYRSTVEFTIISTVEAVEDLSARHADSHIERKIPDGQQFLHFPQVARAGQPVVLDTQFALFEAGEAFGTAHGERAIARQVAVEIRSTGERHPDHVTAKRHCHADSDLRSLPVAIATQRAVALQVVERHGHIHGSD